jgi:hypothetical protein
MTEKELEKKAKEYSDKTEFTEYDNSSLSESLDISEEIKQAYIAGAKAMQKENEQLRNELLQQQQLVRDLKCCGNCDRKENRGLCGYEDRCYSYIYIKQYLRPFFCDPVDLKEIEGYKDYWKPISCTYHIRGKKNDSKRP